MMLSADFLKNKKQKIRENGRNYRKTNLSICIVHSMLYILIFTICTFSEKKKIGDFLISDVKVNGVYLKGISYFRFNIVPQTSPKLLDAKSDSFILVLDENSYEKEDFDKEIKPRLLIVCDLRKDVFTFKTIIENEKTECFIRFSKINEKIDIKRFKEVEESDKGFFSKGFISFKQNGVGIKGESFPINLNLSIDHKFIELKNLRYLKNTSKTRKETFILIPMVSSMLMYYLFYSSVILKIQKDINYYAEVFPFWPFLMVSISYYLFTEQTEAFELVIFSIFFTVNLFVLPWSFGDFNKKFLVFILVTLLYTFFYVAYLKYFPSYQNFTELIRIVKYASIFPILSVLAYQSTELFSEVMNLLGMVVYYRVTCLVFENFGDLGVFKDLKSEIENVVIRFFVITCMTFVLKFIFLAIIKKLTLSKKPNLKIYLSIKDDQDSDAETQMENKKKSNMFKPGDEKFKEVGFHSNCF